MYGKQDNKYCICSSGWSVFDIRFANSLNKVLGRWLSSRGKTFYFCISICKYKGKKYFFNIIRMKKLYIMTKNKIFHRESLKIDKRNINRSQSIRQNYWWTLAKVEIEFRDEIISIWWCKTASVFLLICWKSQITKNHS